ncbi:MAG: hypothetical protein FJ109_08580 [Deltaproteobacteria bacterium]|nr:hypothetical protein [Deltaproteobacteria bacterium]
MSHDRDPSALPLPRTYKLVIVVSVALMFLLGLFYLGLRNRRVGATFQVYASHELVSGLPAAFRAVQFNGVERKNLPVAIESVALYRDGREVATARAQSVVPRLPSDLSLVLPGLEPGPVTARLDLVGWDGEKRSVEVQLDVVAPGESIRHFQAIPELDAPPSVTELDLGLSAAGGGLVDGVPNRLWLRVASLDGAPVDVLPEFRLDEGPVPGSVRSGRLGIASVETVVAGLNANLVMEIPAGRERVVWQEMVAPDRMARLRAARRLFSAEPPLHVQVELLSSLAELQMYCTLWHGGTAIEFLETATRNHSALIDLTLPSRGLYWLTCEDHFVSSDEFPAFLPLLVTSDEGRFLESLSTAFGGPLSAGWPRIADMTAPERERALDYLADRMAPQGVAIAQVVNTYAADLEELKERSSQQRDAVLAVIALLGLALLVWAVAVAIRQHRRLRRSFQEFQEKEDVGDELAREGITRRRSFVPAALVALTFVLNIIALVWLLRLIFS